jgi:hypothetical protein
MSPVEPSGAPRSAGGCAYGAASLVALLQYLANHGSDCLLIGRWHRRDHRSELVPGHVRAQTDRVFLEDATLALQQPLDIYAELLGELSDLVMLERHRRLDLLVRNIARRGNFPDALVHRLFKLAPMRHCFAIGPAHRMRGEEFQVGSKTWDGDLIELQLCSSRREQREGHL